MATLSTSKRLHDLRKKNRNLLKKLESHSSEIQSELKKLKDSTGGLLLRKNNPAKDEKHSEAWDKRNRSRQVFAALCHSEVEKVNVMNLSNKSSISDDSPRKTNVAEASYENNGLSSKCSCARDESGDILAKKIIETNREILNSIDYSPKSVFLRRMKSKYLSHCRCGKTEEERKAKYFQQPIVNLETPDSSVSSQRKEESVSSCKSSVPERKCTAREEGTDFERLKQFRYLNWTDCHAEKDENFLEDDMESKGKLVSLSSAHNKWREKYRINERLFAEPTGLSCKNLVRCSHCLGKAKACDTNTNEVVLSIPSSLLDISDSVDDTKCKKSKKRCSAMKLLTKRPKPCNSMALRYQKGIV